jgi:hypothetical protein
MRHAHCIIDLASDDKQRRGLRKSQGEQIWLGWDGGGRMEPGNLIEFIVHEWCSDGAPIPTKVVSKIQRPVNVLKQPLVLFYTYSKIMSVVPGKTQSNV